MRKLIMGLLVGLLMFTLSAKQYAKYYDIRKPQEIEQQIAEKLYDGWTVVFMVPINQGLYGSTSALLVIYDDGK